MSIALEDNTEGQADSDDGEVEVPLGFRKGVRLSQVLVDSFVVLATSLLLVFRQFRVGLHTVVYLGVFLVCTFGVLRAVLKLVSLEEDELYHPVFGLSGDVLLAWVEALPVSEETAREWRHMGNLKVLYTFTAGLFLYSAVFDRLLGVEEAKLVISVLVVMLLWFTGGKHRYDKDEEDHESLKLKGSPVPP